MNRFFSPRNIVLSIIVGILMGTLYVNQLWAQQDIKASLFEDADKMLKEAKEVNAAILSPKNYNQAMELYQDADRDFQRGRNFEDIRKKLSESVTYFQQAIKATEFAKVTLATSIKARDDANKAGAPKSSIETWEEAEGKFSDATRKLEDGDVNAAAKRAGEAEKLFRQAELEAIKLNYLNETLTLLQEAEELKVKEYAPETLAKAVNMVTQAERELNENRYDTDVARSLARQAKYEAEHAIFLTKIIKGLRDDEDLMEKYLVSTELPLEKIASTLDIVGSFEAGFEKTTKEVITKIQSLQEKSARLEQDLAERENQIELLNSRVNELEEALGGVEQEKSKLAQQMEAQANIRAQFAAVEQLFSREEAQVLRKVDDVIIRLTMLTFPVGKSTIEPQNFALLTKVQRAITMFPECDITVEGHTDSYGGDELNMTLSQDRANAVSQYLLANMGISPSRIEAVGYGEGRPIANNETVEGRTKNRRIEVIIHPKF